LQRIDHDINHHGNDKKEKYEQTMAEHRNFNITDNIYTTYTTRDLEEARSKVDAAVAHRRSKFDEELERQRYNDGLCRKFTSLVDPFVHFITSGKDAITSSNAELEEQLQFVDKRLQTLTEDGKVIDPIKTVSAEMLERNITHNEHTSLTLKDILVQWDQYILFLQNKKKQIEEEIELARLRGLTEENFIEIEDNFRTYDKNNNGYLEFKELKACLYSLGEEKSRSDVEDMLRIYGDGNKLQYQEFLELMIRFLGDADTKDEVLFGFRLINRIPEASAPIAEREKLLNVMKDEFVDYIFDTAPHAGNGVDYAAWTEDVFSR